MSKYIPSKKIYAMVISYNSAPVLGKLYRRIDKNNFDKIYFFDDNSKDNSAKIAEKYNWIIIKNKRNLGHGGNLKKALKTVFRAGADYGVEIHADNQYSPNEVFKAKKMIEANYDLITGSRFKKNDSKIIKIIERPYFLGSVICTYLINKLYKKNFTDIIGAKLFRVAEIRKVTIDNFHSGYDFSFTSKIIKMKLNVGEVFIKYKPREKGQKKLKYYHLFNAVYQIFKVKFLS
jgi:cellulose synthase/poly-beta-1,6-N-acetylglucosamine synthase-like glycosyltransferase